MADGRMFCSSIRPASAELTEMLLPPARRAHILEVILLPMLEATLCRSSRP